MYTTLKTHKSKVFLGRITYHDDNEIEFAKYQTENMWVDMLTKPKQGKSFRRDRSMPVNVDINYGDGLEKKNTDPRLVPNPDKERPFIPIT